MEKLLSIIVPSYNMERYLPKCLGSLIIDDKELLQSVDVIVVNDGSKDRTSEIAHEFEAKYPGVFRVIDKSNGHYGSCVNAALSVAHGVFVKLLDADDYFDAFALSALMHELVAAFGNGTLNEVDAIITDYSSVGDNGVAIGEKRYPYPKRTPFSTDVFQSGLSFHILHQGIAFRHSLLESINYRQSEGCPYTDLEWVTYPIRKVRHFYYLPISLYRYFIGREDQTVNPSNFKKGIGTIVKLMMRMLGDYKNLLDSNRPAVGKYVQKVILAQLKIVYHSYLIERNPYLANDEVLALDEAVRSVPALYAQTDALLADSRRFAFHYVREFRRARSRNTLRFALLRLYSSVAQLRKSS